MTDSRFFLATATTFCTLFILTWGNIHSQEDGFTFDKPEDFSVDVVQPPRKEYEESNQHNAVIGKVFHLTVFSFEKGKQLHGFVAKQQNSKSLPHWLTFNKKTGTFWGVPLPGDEGTLHISVSPSGQPKLTENILIRVAQTNNEDTSTLNCASNEDNTVLTLLLDKNLRAIKPKQRVVAINNIANFFGLPYTTFTLKSEDKTDDITDSSVVLAGPGNVQSRTSKSLSHLEVIVGCDGRLWETTARLVHSLKQQAKDGTISEVLRLPLIGWRVKTETKPALRSKRDTLVDDYGSGDYDEDYYDEYDEYNDEDDLGDIEANPPASKKPVNLPSNPTTAKTTSTSTTAPASTTSLVPNTSSAHPHRHHHGETKPSEENSPDLPVLKNDLQPAVTLPPSSTTTRSQPTPANAGPTKIDIPKPDEALSSFDDNYDYDAYDDVEDSDDYGAESETIVPNLDPNVLKPAVGTMNTSSSSTSSTSTTTTTAKTPVEDDFEYEEAEFEPTTPKAASTAIVPAGTGTTTSETLTSEIVEDSEPPTHIVGVDGTTSTSTSSTILPEIVPVSFSSSTTSTSTTPSTTTTTAGTTTSTTTQPATTPVQFTTPEETVPTTQSSTTTTTSEAPTTEMETTIKVTTPKEASTTTEEVVVAKTIEPIYRLPEPKNTKPYIEKRLQYRSVAAGKIFRYVIPYNTFKDAEDGYNLTISVLDTNEQPIGRNSWLQFNPIRRELYGLPLSEDVSNWVYIVRATDKEGEYEQDQLTVQVQQHRLERVFNHEFVLKLRIEKPQEYPHYVDWSLKVLRALGRVYNTNMSEITVRQINYTSEPVIFAWSNDSLPTNYCPRAEIEELFKVLTANDRGDPSRELSLMLAPDLRIKKVVSHDLTICGRQQPALPPPTPSTNFAPFLRNPVDNVNATLGELLIFKVKDDTFYDPEDVDPSSLNITLLSADLSPIPATNWLQFDTKNREFYGIPRKTGTTEYFLLCVDTGGMTAKDSLEVVVNPAPKRQYNVEFSMTIGVPYETFSNNPAMQRKFVEKLMDIFEESSPGNFHFLPFKAKRESNFDSTVVYWFNKSLPIDKCPTEEIKQIEYLLHSDSRSISSRVHRIMGPDFTVSTIKVHHIGNCKSKPQYVPPTDVAVPSEETSPPHEENDVMITLILPIIIIAIMLFIAFVAACILYRKRRMGKMNVEEDGRQTYGNKGIPVIFQEELEEKPEPGTKAPVILKDEKPPLAPPEYSKSGSVKLEDSEPYQPPPPFTRTQDNGRQPRPKPTPTYRKPPPYVPP